MRDGADQTEPGRSPDAPLTALIVGAGFAGIGAGVELRRRGIEDFLIVDKAGGIGGTWWWNTYPGVACDIPAHFYCFSFAPNPDWSRAYPPGEEIRQYIERTAERFGLTAHIRLNTRLERAVWDEARTLWRVEVGEGETLWARHVISGAGGLHEPNQPEIEGADSFAGEQIHTARWREVEVEDKRVAVIGSAASAIQAAPALARAGAEVTILQRTPNYIAPRGDHAYSDRMKALWRRMPWLMRAWRWFIYKRLDTIVFPITRKESRFGRFVGRRILKGMEATVEDADLRAALTPDYDLGCKRVLVSDEFYPAIASGQVRLVQGAAARIEQDAVVTDGGARIAADLIVYATGYDLEAHFRSMEIVGRGGVRLSQAWSDAIEALRGASVSGFPNFWMITGPNTGVGTTSVVHMIETHLKYVMRLIEAAGSDALEADPGAQAAYNEALQAELAETVWAAGGCASWYKREDGRIETLYPGSARDFERRLAAAGPEEYRRLTPVEAQAQPSRSASVAP